MKNYAVIEDYSVVNVIVAESKEIAEGVVGRQCIEFEINNPLVIGAYWSEMYSKYINPSPYTSWVYNGNEWKPPVNMPQDDNPYAWDEDLLNWVAL
jgi:hypothetical protein